MRPSRFLGVEHNSVRVHLRGKGTAGARVASTLPAGASSLSTLSVTTSPLLCRIRAAWSSALPKSRPLAFTLKLRPSISRMRSPTASVPERCATEPLLMSEMYRYSPVLLPAATYSVFKAS